MLFATPQAGCPAIQDLDKIVATLRMLEREMKMSETLWNFGNCFLKLFWASMIFSEFLPDWVFCKTEFKI